MNSELVGCEINRVVTLLADCNLVNSEINSLPKVTLFNNLLLNSYLI